MRPTWLVAKYVPDIRRQEPVNVGVLLFTDEGVSQRFRGEVEGGRIDGRRATVKGAQLDNYKAWIEYWHDASVRAGDPRELLGHSSDTSYYLQFGGEEIVGSSDPQSLLDELFALLVQESGSEDDDESVKRASERIFKRLGIWEEVRTKPLVQRTTQDGVLDVLRFDYRYDNGRPHLMKTVTIGDSERARQSAQYTAYLFEKLGDVNSMVGTDGLVLTSRPSEGGPLQLLRSVVGTVIDVAAPDAQERLAEVLHVA